VNDKVTIKHPGNNKKVPRQFVAAGTATGTAIKNVRGWVYKLDSAGQPTGSPISGKVWFFVPKNNKYQWMIFFDVSGAGAGNYQLNVVGVDLQGADIQPSKDSVASFPVTMTFPVQIAYPQDQSTITEQEKQYFVAYGTSTNPILFATVGTADTAEYNYFDPTVNFFGSQFPPLHSSGAVTLTIVDYQGQSDARSLNVV
jgi:hypothetical protein